MLIANRFIPLPVGNIHLHVLICLHGLSLFLRGVEKCTEHTINRNTNVKLAASPSDILRVWIPEFRLKVESYDMIFRCKETPNPNSFANHKFLFYYLYLALRKVEVGEKLG